MIAGDERGAARFHQQRPRLVLVSGAPATGKTTLARRLSEALPLPLLARDAIGTIVADAFGVHFSQSSEHGRALLQSTIALYYAMLDQLLRAGVSMLTESTFHRGISERELRPCVAHARSSSTARRRATSVWGGLSSALSGGNGIPPRFPVTKNASYCCGRVNVLTHG